MTPVTLVPSQCRFALTQEHISVCSKYPKMTVELRAPLELENLLPFDLKYRIYDKDADQNWRSVAVRLHQAAV